jgi:thioredoxin 1
LNFWIFFLIPWILPARPNEQKDIGRSGGDLGSWNFPEGAGILFAANNFMTTIQISAADFKDKIFDYDREQEWKFKGEVPAIIDFYADWCGPCKAVAPVLEELATEYDGKLVIYKLDTDKEAELSSLFGIQSIPTFLFIPLEGPLLIQKGALPKHIFKQVIEERLLPKVESAENGRGDAELNM